VSSEEQEPSASPRAFGFAGLSSLVSGAGSIPARDNEARGIPPVPRNRIPDSTQTRASSQVRDEHQVHPRPGNPNASKIVWAAIAAIAVLAGAAVFNSAQNSATSYSAPYGDGDPAVRAGAVATPLLDKSTPPAEPTEATPDSLEPADTLEPAPPDLVEEAPPVAVDRVLNVPELLYCGSEFVRLNAAKEVVSEDADINAFNALVDDFNSRCGSYRYNESDLRTAQKAVQEHKASLEDEGVGRFQRSGGHP
jgi:hypothetical protein